MSAKRRGPHPETGTGRQIITSLRRSVPLRGVGDYRIALRRLDALAQRVLRLGAEVLMLREAVR